MESGKLWSKAVKKEMDIMSYTHLFVMKGDEVQLDKPYGQSLRLIYNNLDTIDSLAKKQLYMLPTRKANVSKFEKRKYLKNHCQSIYLKIHLNNLGYKVSELLRYSLTIL